MARTIRFHLDENVDPAVALGLRHRGVDVTTTAEAGLRTATDEAQLDFARREGRVFVTHDEDFLAVHARDTPHAGIVYCHQQSRSIGAIIRGLVLIWEVYEPEELRAKLEYL